MTLLIDVGNTRIKWAQLKGDGLGQASAIEHDGNAMTAVTAMLDQVAAPPAAVRVANVAGPAFAAALDDSVSQRWQLTVEFARSQSCAGATRNGYIDYHQLGVDRWLAILAGVKRCPNAVCIVDAGTAVTVDMVAAGGAHMGGYIVPGIDLMWRSLASETGDLARFAGAEPARAGAIVPGTDTAAAIEQGGLAMLCALIEDCVRSLAKDNVSPTLLLTGGDAARIIPHLDAPAEHCPQLVLEGLALYAPGA